MIWGLRRRLIRFFRLLQFTAAVLVLLTLISTDAHAQGLSVTYTGTQSIVNPGDSVVGSVRVANESDEVKSLKIYMGDWVRIEDQTSGYQFDINPGNEERSARSWMTYSPDLLTLQPQETREVKIEIRCPDDPDLAGTYWGVVFVEILPADSEGGPQVQKGVQVDVSTIFRYAIQFFVTFKDTEIVNATFSSMTALKKENGADIVAVFENTGNIFMRPKVWLEIQDTHGRVVYKLDHKPQSVLPESSRQFLFELRDLPIPNGTYLLTVIADYGAKDLTAVQGTMEINTTSSPPAKE